MVQRGRRKPLVLTVRPLFEPGRLAPSCLADAYERAVPVKRRATRTVLIPSDIVAMDSTRQTGGTKG